MKTCSKCKIEKEDSEFYKRNTKGREQQLAPWCKTCICQNSSERKLLWKKEALEYRGKACFKCGYDKCSQAMDFHHMTKSEKEFGFGNRKGHLTDKDMSELDKCKTVCCMCHREIHAGIAGSIV